MLKREDYGYSAPSGRTANTRPNERHASSKANASAPQDETGKPAGPETAPARPDVGSLYEAVRQDWNRLVERASEAGVPTFDMEGSELLITRMRSLTENPELPARTRQALAGVIQEFRQGELALEGGHVGAPMGAETVVRDVAGAPAPDHAATPVESAAARGDTVAPPADEDRAPSQVQEPTPPVPDPDPETGRAGLAARLRSVGPGLECSRRKCPAKRHPDILRQGLRRSDPAPPGARGKPGYSVRNTSARDPGA